MSLKLKLFLFFGSLMALLMLTQWWLVRRISTTTVEQFANDTIDLTKQMVEFFNQEFGRNSEGETLRVIRTVENHTVEAGEEGKVDTTHETLEGLVRPGSVDLPSREVPDGEQETELDGPIGRRVKRMFELSGRIEQGETQQLAIRLAGPGAEKKISISTDELSGLMGLFQTQLIFGTALILVVGLVAAGVLANRISRPLQELSAASADVAAGNWGRQVEAGGSAELNQAIGAFNRMSKELENYAAAQEAWQKEKHLSDLGEVARGLAHTIRNPLNGLGLCLEELANQGPETVESEQLVRAGRLQIQRIDQWIRSFLTLASQSDSLVEVVRWEPLIEDIVLELAQTSSHNLIEVDPAFKDLPAINGIEAEIRAMLQTLLANAVEASPPQRAIELRGSLQREKVLIEVIDQGSGLTEAVRENLFSPHITNKANGSGMGLYLTKQIATTRYFGNLELDDNPSGGTRASLTLGRQRNSS